MTKHEQILSMLPAKFMSPILTLLPTGFMFIYEVVSPINKDGIWLRINDGSFYCLEEKDRNYDLIADEILKNLTNEFIQS